MKWAIFLGLSLICLGHGSWAENYAGCDKGEVRVINEALRNAKDLTLKAASTIGDTPEYTRWFGDYSPRNAETVRGTLKAVVSAIRGGAVTAQCDATGVEGCEGGTYAWVYAGAPYHMYLCPPFFQLPVLAALQPGSRRSDNGTREGTLVHELSHFSRVGATEDHCYSRSECADMASRDPRRAIENADSYQYFTEDVTYYARQPVAGKPPVADREGE